MLPHGNTRDRSLSTVLAVNELDALIEEASRRGYRWHQFRSNHHGPDVLAGVFRWERCVDVVVLTDEKGTHAYRTPNDPDNDVFAPSHIHWWYGRCDGSSALPGGSMVWILRALLTLPTPDEVGGFSPLMPAPKGTGVPVGEPIRQGNGL